MKKLLLLTLVLLGGVMQVSAWNYLNGTFNLWTDNAASCLDNGPVAVYLEASATPYEFGIDANGSWKGPNGNADISTTTTGISSFSGSGNFKLTVSTSGYYVFSLDWTGGMKLNVNYPDTRVYFKNVFDWENVYLHDGWWNGDNGATNKNTLRGVAMTEEANGIYSAYIPRANFTRITFTSDKQVNEGGTDHGEGYENFYGTNVVWNANVFNSSTPIYVPTGDPTKLNNCDYYYGGSWQYAITPGKKYTTYVTSDKADFTGLELKAYKATSANASGVVFDEVGAVPANTPLLLKGTPGTLYSVPVAASADDIDVNLLVAGDGSTTIGGESNYDYILSDGKFYRASSGTVAVGKAYLHLTKEPALAQELSIIFSDDEETDGINAVKGIMPEVIGESYNLAGQKVGANYKGIVIVNGKKVVRK